MSRALCGGLLAVAAGCSGDLGVLGIDLVTAPGATHLDAAEVLRLTLTDPRTVREARRGADGFALTLDVPAEGQAATVIVEALDASGATVAVGQSPPIQLGPLTARVAIFVAPPLSVETAPAALADARTEIGLAPLPYGAVLAGGRDAGGAAVDTVAIYNAYDHALTLGLPLPAPRAGLAAAAGLGGRVYLFGGADAAGATTGTLWRFATEVAPSGAYTELADVPGFARAGATLTPIGAERFLASGAPVVEVTTTGLVELPTPAALGAGASVTTASGDVIAVFAGAEGITRRAADAFATLDATPRAGARVVALPDRTFAITGDASGALVRVAADGGLTVTPGFLAGRCPAPALAATARHLVLVCPATTHVLDAADLGEVAVIARGGHAALALPTAQVLIADPAGLALFTPPAPPAP